MGTIFSQATDPRISIAGFSGNRAAAISYTFDDGLRDQYTVAIPMFNELGLKATFFIIPGRVVATPEEGERIKNKKRAWGGISWPELKEMAEQGHEIGNHTWSHPNLTKLTAAEVEEQFSKADQSIQEHLGILPLTIAFPFSAQTPEIEALALKNHLAYRAYQTSISGQSTVENLNTWADKLVRDKKWGVIMGHGIAYGYAALTDPEILREHLKYAKSHEADIWIDTFAHIAAYKKQHDNAEHTVSEKADGLTLTLKSKLTPPLPNTPLTVLIEGIRPKSAEATRNGISLSVKIKGNTLQIEAEPSPAPVSVTWKVL
ncbi:MAG: polysaccharide deacetylase family protein [Chthoniobacterales bacterium]